MQSLARNGYTAAEVDAQLHSANVTMKFKYDLLTSTNAFKSALATVEKASVANNSLANIKRTARFTIVDDGAINYLRDRIKPYARLLMPDINRLVDNSRKSSLSLDGIDDFVDCGNSAVFNLSASWSIEAWINRTSDGGAYERIISKSDINDYDYWLQVSTGNAIECGYIDTIGTTRSVVDSTPMPLNTWVHVAAVFNGSTITILINGSTSTVSAAFPNAPRTSAKPLNFGRLGSAGAWYYGFASMLRDVRIWNVARTQAQIQANMNNQLVGNEAGLVGYWRLDDGTGLSARDYTLNANNGTLTNGPVWVTNGSIAIPSSYAEFPLGVFVLSTPPRSADLFGNIRREVEAYDLLQVLVDDKVTDRYTIASGANYVSGTNGIKALLDGAGITSQNLTATTSALPAARDWPPSTTKLQIINDLLGAINYRSLYFDENGVATAIPYQSPAARASEYTYVDDDESVMFPEVEQALDLFAVANRWTLVVSEPDRTVLTSTYTNSNPSSQTSTVNRGRTIVDYRENQEAADQTTLDALAARIAFEASQVFETVTFETGIMPQHSDSDVYMLIFSTLGISSKYSEVSWEFELKAGARMKHSIRKVVYV